MEQEYQEIYTIGEIDFSNIIVEIDEAIQLNLTGNLSKCKIQVKGLEGPVPHFHLTSNTPSNVKGNKGPFECCICIYEALYFNHGKAQDKLSKKQCELLNEWMKLPYTTPEGINTTNWGAIAFSWRLANNEGQIPNNPKQPDYRNLKNMRN